MYFVCKALKEYKAKPVFGSVLSTVMRLFSAAYRLKTPDFQTVTFWSNSLEKIWIKDFTAQ